MSDAVRARKTAEARYWRAHAARTDADRIGLPKHGHRYQAYETEAQRASELADAIEAELQESEPVPLTPAPALDEDEILKQLLRRSLLRELAPFSWCTKDELAARCGMRPDYFGRTFYGCIAQGLIALIPHPKTGTDGFWVTASGRRFVQPYCEPLPAAVQMNPTEPDQAL